MTSSIWIFILTGAMLVAFSCAWLFGKKINNYSLVDAVWAGGIGLVGATWLLFGTASFPKRIAALVILVFWSFRLTKHLATRIYRTHPEEDSRYQELRSQWKPHVAAWFFGFFQLQAISTILLALPFYFVAFGTTGSWGAFESMGLGIAVIGIVGEATADHQLSVFKQGDPDPKSICKNGLWNYSRHPNYFFEAVIWLGFYLFACGSDWGWTTLHAPAIITFLLLKVTGIPPSEKSSLARKGDAYRRYQESTSAFIPLPPKHP